MKKKKNIRGPQSTHHSSIQIRIQSIFSSEDTSLCKKSAADKEEIFMKQEQEATPKFREILAQSVKDVKSSLIF